MKHFMKHSSPALIQTEPRDHDEKKSNNLLQSKHAGLTSSRWPVVLMDHNFFPTTALGNASGFSYQWTNSSYTG